MAPLLDHRLSVWPCKNHYGHGVTCGVRDENDVRCTVMIGERDQAYAMLRKGPTPPNHSSYITCSIQCARMRIFQLTGIRNAPYMDNAPGPNDPDNDELGVTT